jgi:hypothetical protein
MFAPDLTPATPQLTHQRSSIAVRRVPLAGVVVNPQRRRVELTLERWQHITTRHPEVASHQADILRAVRRPTALRAISTDESWYYLARAGPSAWLKVVVVYSRGSGWIVTAFPRRAMP